MARASLLAAIAALALSLPAFADGNLHKVNHIIIAMQENHSYDNYFGALAYVRHTPYYNARNGACAADDHKCVDGLSCLVNSNGQLVCSNANWDKDGGWVHAFHARTRCVKPDLDHGWNATHREMNFRYPNATLSNPLSDGFVRMNDITEQKDQGESPFEDQTMSFFDDSDIPLYYSLAKTFAISDRQFSSVLGPTIPNRFYMMAATSFGHLTTNDTVPPAGGYKPITGTIFDLLDRYGVTWADYFEDVPQAALFRTPDAHTLPFSAFLEQAAGKGPALPQVVFIDPNLGTTGTAEEDDEHPPTDIQRGQHHISQVVNALRKGPYWKDSILFVTYDEHGGYYDHAKPPKATQGSLRTPDDIAPGQCADLSNPPASKKPGGGAECASNPVSKTDTTLRDAEKLCPALTKDPTGPFPSECASFDQFGVRVPFIAVSPFAKPAYVSHVARDHTAMLALIEKRFMPRPGYPPAHLTRRDLHAASLEDMFDFDTAPSLYAKVGAARAPAKDCTPARVGP